MNVFLVEDALPIRERIRNTVEEAGGKVVGEATSELEAVAGVMVLRPDVAVVDLLLAKGSGIEVIRRIKQDAPQTLVVVLTNHAHSQYWQACMEAGAEFFFDKTANFSHFVEAMRTMGQSIQLIGKKETQSGQAKP